MARKCIISNKLSANILTFLDYNIIHNTTLYGSDNYPLSILYISLGHQIHLLLYSRYCMCLVAITSGFTYM